MAVWTLAPSNAHSPATIVSSGSTVCLTEKSCNESDEVLHDCFIPGNNPTILMNDNDVIRHELSELFDISSLNGRSPTIG